MQQSTEGNNKSSIVNLPMGCASIGDYQSIKQKGSLKLGTLSYPLPVKNWTHLWNPLIGQFTKIKVHEILKILELVGNIGIKYLVDRLRLVTKAEVYHKNSGGRLCRNGYILHRLYV